MNIKPETEVEYKEVIDSSKFKGDVKRLHQKFNEYMASKKSEIETGLKTNEVKRINIMYTNGVNLVFDSISKTFESVKRKQDIDDLSYIRTIAIFLYYFARIKPINVIVETEKYDKKVTISVLDVSIEIGLEFALATVHNAIGISDYDLPSTYKESLEKTLSERSITKAMVIELLFIYATAISDWNARLNDMENKLKEYQKTK